MVRAEEESLNRAIKRGLDILGAGLGLIMLSPLFLALAAAVRLSSPGPILFRQERPGRFGRSFPMLKFRSMVAGDAKPANREAQAGDPRITQIGHFLRRTGLDELPQLINVLRGEMSLVGPRPLLAWENELCDTRQSRRLLVRPGLTGLSQVNGRNAIPWEDRIEWDLRYIEEMTPALDLAILLRTIPVCMLGRDAYAEQPAPPDTLPVHMLAGD